MPARPTAIPTPVATQTLSPTWTPRPATTAIPTVTLAVRPLMSVEELNNYLDRVDVAVTPLRGPREGYLLGFDGDDCEYFQVETDESMPNYFWAKENSSFTILIFDDEGCMTGRSMTGNLPMRIATNQVNTILARWYHAKVADVEYITDPDKLRREPLPDSRGWCIASKRPPHGIAVEYFTATGGLRAIAHDVGFC